MTVSLNADTRRKVAASARLLLSDKPGEVVAALNAMGRLLPDGVSVPDLIEQSLTAGSAQPLVPAPTVREIEKVKCYCDEAFQMFARECAENARDRRRRGWSKCEAHHAASSS